MQPIPWSELWPPAAEVVFVPRLVTGAVAAFALGSWFGRLVAHPLAAKLLAGTWLAAATAGLVVRLGVPIAETALVPRSPLLSVGLAFGIGLVALPAVVAAGRLPEMQRFYPELWPWLNAARGPWERGASVAGTWLVYLIGYEALFRGLLLPLLVAALGVWPGMAVATGLYVLAHLDRPSAETFAAIPAGFVFALLTLATGSFLAAVLVHWMIATTSELAAAARAATSDRSTGDGPPRKHSFFPLWRSR